MRSRKFQSYVFPVRRILPPGCKVVLINSRPFFNEERNEREKIKKKVKYTTLSKSYKICGQSLKLESHKGD